MTQLPLTQEKQREQLLLAMMNSMQPNGGAASSSASLASGLSQGINGYMQGLQMKNLMQQRMAQGAAPMALGPTEKAGMFGAGGYV